jgi:pimeloyl-ACP methyl ester carboxylesterase/DNA-binding winged helix-turn-helix (wHTH) protein
LGDESISSETKQIGTVQMTSMQALGSIRLANWEFDLDRLQLKSESGEQAPLRYQSAQVLKYLAIHAGQTVRKAELLDHVWPDRVVTEDSLTQCVSDIREVIGDKKKLILITEPKIGYRLIPTELTDDFQATLLDGRPFEQTVGFATALDGVQIAYAIAGQGPRLVRASHVMTHLNFDWRAEALGPRIRRLASNFEFLRYDERGTGLSQRNVSHGPPDRAVGDLKTVVDAAGWERFALIGSSGGVVNAIRFAAQHPERVNKLVLLGGRTCGPVYWPDAKEQIELTEAKFKLLRAGWETNNPAYRQLSVVRRWPNASRRLIESFTECIRVSCSVDTAIELERVSMVRDARPHLEGVRCPTLVIHSRSDPITDFSHAELMVSSIQGARLVAYDSPNHTPVEGEPDYERVLQTIEEFLRAQAN